MTVDWGTVPAWISALATAAGVTWAITAFTINARRERSVIANSIVCRVEDGFFVIENWSQAPIHDLTASAHHGANDIELDLPGSTLAPGGSSMRVPRDRAEGFSISFRDPRGWLWAKQPDGHADRLRRS